MPPMTANDDLSLVDPEPTPAQRDAARALIAAEFDTAASQQSLHPDVPDSDWEPSFSPAMLELHKNIDETGAPRLAGQGVDLSRYDEIAAPSDGSDAAAWRDSLKKAYTAHTYLTARLENLSALEHHGKNAWLIANFQAENVLRSYEQQLKETGAAAEQADARSRQLQGSAKSELDAMNESWKAGLGRAIETEVATEGLRRAVLQKRRNLALAP